MYLITFNNVTDALALEEYAHKKELGGEIISLPSSLDAGCGFAYLLEVESVKTLKEHLNNDEINFAKILLWDDD